MFAFPYKDSVSEITTQTKSSNQREALFVIPTVWMDTHQETHWFKPQGRHQYLQTMYRTRFDEYIGTLLHRQLENLRHGIRPRAARYDTSCATVNDPDQHPTIFSEYRGCLSTPANIRTPNQRMDNQRIPRVTTSKPLNAYEPNNKL